LLIHCPRVGKLSDALNKQTLHVRCSVLELALDVRENCRAEYWRAAALQSVVVSGPDLLHFNPTNASRSCSSTTLRAAATPISSGGAAESLFDITVWECRRQRAGRQSAAATVLRIVMRALFFASKNFREDVDNRDTLQAECERRSTIQQCNDSARCLSFYA